MSFVFNKNHNRTHVPGCRAVGMMNRAKNEVRVEEPQGHICKWCGAIRHRNQTTLDSDRVRGVEICTDPYVRDIFKKAGCLNGCGNLGDIEMYRHDDGVTVDGRKGLWWVYFRCFECGYETNLQKALDKIKGDTQQHKCSHAPVEALW